jgi:hypothetical protein
LHVSMKTIPKPAMLIITSKEIHERARNFRGIRSEKVSLIHPEGKSCFM